MGDGFIRRFGHRWSWTGRVMLLIASAGMIGLALLSLRQQRLQAMHELSACRLRQEGHDKRLWSVRAALAEQVTPERVSLMRPEVGG